MVVADPIDGFADGNDQEEDSFTGNGGADKFVFNIAQSVVAAATATIVAEGVDFEEITATNTYGPGATVRFEFIIGALSPAFVTITDGVGGADLSTTAGVASALNAAIDARPDAIATVSGSVVTARGIDAASLIWWVPSKIRLEPLSISWRFHYRRTGRFW